MINQKIINRIAKDLNLEEKEELVSSVINNYFNYQEIEIRDELIKIRVMQDTNPIKAKQLITNLMKKLK
ncbi:MAG: hypothetical protein ACQERX_02090 [Bacillota bacterium]